MKSMMDIVAMMNNERVRKDEGPYSFGFTEGVYKIEYNSHSTGRDLRIFITAPDGDRMLVYDKTEWYSSRYHFNGFGKGFVAGPWVKEINDMFVRFRSEIAVAIVEKRKRNRAYKAEKTEKDALRHSKFSALCVG